MDIYALMDAAFDRPAAGREDYDLDGDQTIDVDDLLTYYRQTYGDPAAGVHSLQMELAQCLYMQEAVPFEYLPEQAAQLQPLLREVLGRIIDWAEAQ